MKPMTAKRPKYQRRGTRISADGRTVLAWLRIDRRNYEFGRALAGLNADADPRGTAETELEGCLNSDVSEQRERMQWSAPPEIEALYDTNDDSREYYDSDFDDGIPF
jgi:hypothetical protein